MGKATGDLTPEQRAAMAERERRLKSQRRDAEQALMRQIGEKLGMARMAESLRRIGTKLPKVETNPAELQPQTPDQPKRGRGGGRKSSITPEQCKRGIRILRNQSRMTVEAARETLRAAGIEGSDSALYRLVIAPAYSISK